MAGLKSETWYVAYVYPRREHAVGRLLAAKGYDVFVPTRRVGNSKMADLVLFPGYVFFRFLDERCTAHAVTTPFVIRLLSDGTTPKAVPESEIAAVKRVLECDLPFDEGGPLCPGEPVRLVDGPLRGVEGVVLRLAGVHRLQIGIGLINRFLQVTVQSHWVKRGSFT
jgi:transcription antitermination factor NusG